MTTFEKTRLIVDIVTLVVAFAAGWMAYRQLKNANKNARFRGTADLFDRFNAPEARADRRWVYHSCKKLLNKEKLYLLQLDSEHLDHLENACNYLDWVSLNIKNGLINEDDAISIYGDSFVRCWVILRPWIKFTQSERSQIDSLWKNIEPFSNKVMNSESYKSWKENGIIIYTPYEKISVDYKTSEINFIKSRN